MAVPSPSRPPLWARNNARKAIDQIDGTPAYVSFLKLKPKLNQVIQKAAAERKIKNYLHKMQLDGRLLITGRNQFIAPCLGTVSVSEDNEVERNVMFSRFEYKFQRTGVVTNFTTFMNIPHHAFSRIFERDLRPPEEVAQALMRCEFIDNVMKLHTQSDPLAPANSFAIRFLNGFLTGTAREMHLGLFEEPIKVLDVRTFLHRNHKPDWVQRTMQTPYTLFEYADRRSEKLEAETLSDIIENLQATPIFGDRTQNYKELPGDW